VYIADVVIASCSAPTYFSSHNNLIDGGVVAVNPSLVAWNDLLYHGHKVDYMLSLSSVICNKKEKLELDNAGVAQYASAITDIILDDNVDLTHYFMQNILKDKYKRVSFLLDEEIKLDDYAKINVILKAKESIL